MKIRFKCKVKSLKQLLNENIVEWKICDEELIANTHFGKGVGNDNNGIYFFSTSEFSIAADDRHFSFISQHAKEIFIVVVDVPEKSKENAERHKIDLLDFIAIEKSDKEKMTLFSVELIYG